MHECQLKWQLICLLKGMLGCLSECLLACLSKDQLKFPSKWLVKCLLRCAEETAGMFADMIVGKSFWMACVTNGYRCVPFLVNHCSIFEIQVLAW